MTEEKRRRFSVILERPTSLSRARWSDALPLSQRVKADMALSKEAALEAFRQQIEESCSVKRSFSAELLENIWRLTERTIVAYRSGKKVLLMGNGGSAADAQHPAADFLGRIELLSTDLPAIAHTQDYSILTALSH